MSWHILPSEPELFCVCPPWRLLGVGNPVFSFPFHQGVGRAARQPPERELCGGGRPSPEPPALLRAHPACRRSESSGGLPNPADTRLCPGSRKEVELALAGDEAKVVPLECPLPAPKGLPFPHEAVEVCKREAVLGRPEGRGRRGQPAAPAEKPAPEEKARETGGAEGTGDAVLGENALGSQESDTI